MIKKIEKQIDLFFSTIKFFKKNNYKVNFTKDKYYEAVVSGKGIVACFCSNCKIKDMVYWYVKNRIAVENKNMEAGNYSRFRSLSSFIKKPTYRWRFL